MKFILILLFVPFACFGQNLVKNPGFELSDQCPDAGFECFYPYVKFWSSPMAWSPSYYHSCASKSCPGVGTPSNWLGFQAPRSGMAYADLLTLDKNPWYPPSNKRTYLTGDMDPMQKDSVYCIQFYLSLADYSTHALDRVGCALTDSFPADYGNDSVMPLLQAVTSPPGEILAEKNGWLNVRGLYRSLGGEKYITIGNFFFEKDVTVVKLIDTTGSPAPGAAYYLDDVSVTMVSSCLLSLDLGPDTLLCDTAGFLKTLQAPGCFDSCRWSTGQSGNSITVNRPGTYWVRCMSGCGDRTDTIRIKYLSPRTLDLGHDTGICPEQIPFRLESPVAFDHYLWNTADTTQSILVTGGGLYWCHASYPCGTAADSVRITMKPVPPIPVVADTFACQGDTAFHLQAAGENIRWYISATDFIGQDAAPPVDVSMPGITTFFVTQKVEQCLSEREEVQILVDSPPLISLPDSIRACTGEQAVIGVEQGNFIYQWSTGQTVPKIEVAEDGIYSLKVTNACGVDSASIHVVFYPCGSCLLVPNAFSPDGDGINDLFRPIAVCPVADFHMEIYDRWGGRVCEVRDMTRGWDGTGAGQLMPPGVYPYVIRFSTNERKAVELYRGAVVLLN